MNTLPAEYTKAKEALKESDSSLAFSIIRPFLDYPGRIEDDAMWNDIFTLFKSIVSPIFGEDSELLIQAVIDDPVSVEDLYDLAYLLYEQGLNGVAATLLRKALDVDPPNTKVITELSTNLEVLMYFEEARKMLVDSRVYFGDDSLCLYLLGFNSLMTGNIDDTQSVLEIIEKDPDDTIQHMYMMLRGMINRALALKKTRALDNKDLRGWHLSINGTILLHLSPYGFEDAMYGRYAFISDSYPLIKDGILRIGKILESTDVEIKAIIPLPDRGSRAIGIAASKILDIPLLDWSDSDENTQGLIVAYDLDEIEDSEISIRLNNHAPQQILWAHASCWTNVFPFSADIATYLYQSKVAPWDAQLAYIEKEVQMSTEDESNEIELADRIIEAELDDEYFDDANDVISLIESMKTVDVSDAPGIFQTSGKRLRFREGSPVVSNRFL
jgi:hypothetical protein